MVLILIFIVFFLISLNSQEILNYINLDSFIIGSCIVKLIVDKVEYFKGNVVSIKVIEIHSNLINKIIKQINITYAQHFSSMSNNNG